MAHTPHSNHRPPANRRFRTKEEAAGTSYHPVCDDRKVRWSAITAAKLTSFRIYDLRHTFASRS